MRRLAPLPAHVRFLTSVEDERLEAKYPHVPLSTDTCEICQGTKTFRWYESLSVPLAQRVVVDYECPCLDQLLLQRYLLHSGVLRLYGKLTWMDTEGVPPDLLSFTRKYGSKIEARARSGIGLYFYGEHGTGKTLMVSLLAKRALMLGLNTYMTTLNELINAYSDTWYGTKEDKLWFEHRVRNARLLVVDDMGREFAGRTAAESSVDAIFRTRVQAGLATLITTNITAEQFAVRYTKGMTSLVDQSCQRFEVPPGTPDYRTLALDRDVAESDAGLSRPYGWG